MRALLFHVSLLASALAAQEAASRPQQPPAPADEATYARIGDITTVHGVQENTLTGMGVVLGLASTGSGDKATRQATANFVRRNNLNIADSDLTSGAAALVAVTAILPAFAKEGQPIDVAVQSVGDATSLLGGVLQFTELKGPDGNVYATGTGPISIGGGFSAGDKAGRASVTRGHPTAGKILNGGTIVQEPHDASRYLREDGSLQLRLLGPNENTALAIAEIVNDLLGKTGVKAEPLDRTLVRIELPKDQHSEQDAMRVLALLQERAVRVHNPNTVVISESTGFLLAGGSIQISPCVLALSDLTISIVNEEDVSQPNPFAPKGATSERVTRTRIEVQNSGGQPKALKGGITVQDLLANLKALELSPRQLIEVFQQLYSARYLHAPVIVR